MMESNIGYRCLVICLLMLPTIDIVEGSPPYQYVGCYWSTVPGRIHVAYYNISVTGNNSPWILDECINVCEVKGHKYMAIRGIPNKEGLTYYCTCGDVDPSSEPLIIEAPAGSCPLMCPSATEYNCGAPDHYVSLYKTGFLTAPSSLESVTIAATSSPASTEAADYNDYTSSVVYTSPLVNDGYKTNTVPTSNTGLIAGIVVFAIVLIVCIVGFIIYRRSLLEKLKEKRASPSSELQNARIVSEPVYETLNLQAIPAPLRGDGINLQPIPAPLRQEDGTTLLPLIQFVPATYTRISEANTIYDNIYVNQNIRNQIMVDSLTDHIAEIKKSNNPFHEEFNNLPSGKLAATELGERKSLLKMKNRFKNIVAYDHSRVCLEKQNDDPLSEYINANYIDGYNKEKEFIATQGPMPKTLVDFWRMIWEQRVSIVVMMTNLKEGKKTKCERYWPSKSETKMYGNLRVTFERMEIWPDCTIRTLTMQKGTESRIVRQYHFTSWPDHGVPQHACPLLALRRKVRKEMAKSQGPTVLHCSNGVGRTGTYLALDYLLQQAEAEGLVDVSTCVTLLRANRINMIQTIEQYVFVYDGLLEALTLGETIIPCSQFQNIYYNMLQPEGNSIENKISKQYMMLEKDRILTLKYFQGAKKQYKASVPFKNARPHITRLAEGTDYLNAVFIKGYREDKAFIVTQKPLENTRDDLWRMTYENECPAIVSFHDTSDTEEGYREDKAFIVTQKPLENTRDDLWRMTYENECPAIVSFHDTSDTEEVRYWPDTGENEVTGHMKVSTEEEDQSQPGTHYTLKLEKAQPSQSDVAVKVHLFHLTWSVASGDDLGPSSDLISIHSSVQRVHQQSSQSGPVVVQCLLDTNDSGIFCAVSSLINMINTEQEVDVVHIVKQIRENRPQLINTKEEFGYLYKVVKDYLDSFDNYSNFTLLDTNKE